MLTLLAINRDSFIREGLMQLISGNADLTVQESRLKNESFIPSASDFKCS